MCKDKYGCRYLKFNIKTMREECILTKTPTNGDIKCDFDYKQCPEYKKALEPLTAPSATAAAVPPRGATRADGQLEGQIGIFDSLYSL